MKNGDVPVRKLRMRAQGMPLLLCGRLDSILLSIEAWDASLFAT
jgi:hypothetical protein